MNRRQLFARLSALALAPLAKWLPKEEFPWCRESYVIGCDLAGPKPSYTVFWYASSDEMIAALNASHERFLADLHANTERYLWPIPQEES